MKATGWLLFVGALGAVFVALGTEIQGFQSWDQMLTPAFAGKALFHVGTTIGAFVGGKLIPTARPVWTSAERQAFREQEQQK